MNRKVWILLAAIAMTALFNGPAQPGRAYDPGSVRIVIDNQELITSPAGFIEDGRTLVPMRAILEQLGATLTWDKMTRTATAQKPGYTVRIAIDQHTAWVNGKPVFLDVPARLVQSRTFLPLRFTAESFGADVKWDPVSRTASITSPGMPQFFSPQEAPHYSQLLNARVVDYRRTRGISPNAMVVESNSQTLPDPTDCSFSGPVAGYFNCYKGFQGIAASIDWEYSLRGIIRVDNRRISTSSTVAYKQKNTGTKSMTIAGSFAGGTEATLGTPILRFAETKLSAQITVSTSGTFGWEQSTEIEDTWQVASGKVGYTYCYLAGGKVHGTAFYDLYEYDEDNLRFRFARPLALDIDADPPSAGAYNYVHVEADS